MKRIISWLFVSGTFLTVVVYFAACLTPYISPATFWPMTFLGLGFPIVAVVFLAVIFVWVFLKIRMAAILILFFLIAGYKNLSSTVAVNFFNDEYQKDSSTLRIVDWNISYLGNSNKHAESPDSIRRKMINYLKEADADILLVQEFMEYHNPAIYSNIEVLRDTLGYQYFYFTRDKVQYYSYGKLEYGVVIFSKVPLIDTGKLEYTSVNVSESIGYADIQFKNRRLRVATTHLLSMGLFKPEEAQEEGRFINYDKAYFIGKSRYRPLRLFDSIHALQAEVAREFLNKSPYPTIMTGDFNSVPTSYVYHKIRGDLNDAFIEKGKGLSTTYRALSPTLRIDYVLTDPSIKVKHYQRPKVFLSDHFPIIVDIDWDNKK